MIQWRDLTKREKTLVLVLVVMLGLMYLSHQPELIGINLAITMSWAALIVFFGMLGVLIFMPEK